MGKKDSKKKWMLFVICIVVFLTALVVGIFAIRAQMSKSAYSESIKTAEKYLEDGDYEQAALEYEKAIENRPEEEQGYIGLAELYLRQGESSAAKILLKRGAAYTDSTRIQYMIDGIEDGSMLAKALEAGSGEEMKKETMQSFGKLSLNTAFLQKLEHYNFTDYCEQFGGFPEIVKAGKGTLEVVHKDFAGTCYYANTEEQNDIVDETQDKPAVDGMPAKVSVDSVTQIFQNFPGKITLSTLNTLSSSRVEPIVKGDRTYVELSTASLLIRIESDAEGNIVSDTVWNEIILKNANKDRHKDKDKKENEEEREERSQAGTLTGVIVDASTGEGIAGAGLAFQAEAGEANNRSTSTAEDGSFSIELESGKYTVTITAEGYIEETFAFEMEANKNYSGEQFVISPKMLEGTARIVLEWQEQPRDLDAHLMGETDKGESLHVFFGESVNWGEDGEIAELDIDDRNGYGPETITLYDLNGVYTYAVEDYEHTGTLQQYGATVKVYLPGQEAPTVITLDPNAGIQDLWAVFRLDHGELQILNRAWEETDYQ